MLISLFTLNTRPPFNFTQDPHFLALVLDPAKPVMNTVPKIHFFHTRDNLPIYVSDRLTLLVAPMLPLISFDKRPVVRVQLTCFFYSQFLPGSSCHGSSCRHHQWHERRLCATWCQPQTTDLCTCQPGKRIENITSNSGCIYQQLSINIY